MLDDDDDDDDDDDVYVENCLKNHVYIRNRFGWIFTYMYLKCPIDISRFKFALCAVFCVRNF